MKSAVRTLDDLGIDLVLAPERHLASLASTLGDGVPLGELVVERTERASPSDLDGAIVLDTTHARDGVLDVGGAVRDRAGDAKSTKKLARAGDLVVSRLRPYLRQIAYVHPRALGDAETLALSSEFYVLTSKKAGADLAFLLPFLLGEPAQRALAAAQEGGHHPRVPRASLFALPIPHGVVRARNETSRKVKDALAAYYAANARLAELIRP